MSSTSWCHDCRILLHSCLKLSKCVLVFTMASSITVFSFLHIHFGIIFSLIFLFLWCLFSFLAFSFQKFPSVLHSHYYEDLIRYTYRRPVCYSYCTGHHISDQDDHYIQETPAEIYLTISWDNDLNSSMCIFTQMLHKQT